MSADNKGNGQDDSFLTLCLESIWNIQSGIWNSSTFPGLEVSINSIDFYTCTRICWKPIINLGQIKLLCKSVVFIIFFLKKEPENILTEQENSER